jgi:RNA polymerase sigma-70 factor (ECF subfamily)
LTSTREFDVFYRDGYQRLVGQVFILTTDLGAAQDAVQEAFVRAWARWADVAELDVPEAWVRRVAMNIAVSGWRRVNRVVPSLPIMANVVFPDEVVEVLELLSQLPEVQRRVLALHHLVGMSIEDVAAEVGAPVGTVKSWLARGRHRLSALIRECEEVTA